MVAPAPVSLPAKPRFRGRSHQFAALAFPPLGAVLVVLADSRGGRIAAVVYILGVTAMNSVSACYHRLAWSEAGKRRMRRLDHSTILLAIAGTYTPMAAIGVGGVTGKRVVVAVWVLAGAGIAVRNLWITAPRWMTSGVYLVVGWVALAALPSFWRHLGGFTFGLVVGGGALYSVGAIVYARKSPDPWPATFGYHEVFHALVVGAGLLFYAAAARVLL